MKKTTNEIKEKKLTKRENKQFREGCVLGAIIMGVVIMLLVGCSQAFSGYTKIHPSILDTVCKDKFGENYTYVWTGNYDRIECEKTNDDGSVIYTKDQEETLPVRQGHINMLKPEHLIANQEMLDNNLKQDIKLNCRFIRDNPNDLTMAYFPEAENLCRKIYPDLWVINN